MTAPPEKLKDLMNFAERLRNTEQTVWQLKGYLHGLKDTLESVKRQCEIISESLSVIEKSLKIMEG